MMNRSKSLVGIIVIVLLSMLLAACGADSTATVVTAPTATTAPAAPTDTVAVAAPTDTVAAATATSAMVAPTDTAMMAAPTATTAMAATATSGTTAAASLPTSTPNAGLSGTVTFWTAYNADSPEVDTLNNTIIPAFEKIYPNVKVTAQAFPYDDLRQKLLTAVAGGETPDLLRADIIWVPEFANLGAFAKLDEVMPDFKTYQSAVFEGPLQTNYFKGNYYGLPLDTNTRSLFYDQDLMGQAGITTAPKTIDEFTADCAKIKALNKPDTYCFAEGGTGAWNVLPWIWSNGGAVTDDQYTKATGYLNGAASVKAVSMLNDWLKEGYLSPSILGGGISTSDAMGKGQDAILVDGPWMPSIFKGQFPDLKLGLSQFPAGAGGSVSVVGGEDITMFEASKNKDAAMAFMRYMLSEDAQIALGKVGQMPVLKSLTGNSELPDYYGTFQQQLLTAKPRTPNPNWPKIDDAISGAVLSVLRGEKEPQAAMDEAAATVDTILAAK